MSKGNILKELQTVVGAEQAFSAEDSRAGLYRSIFGSIAGLGTSFVAVALPANADQLQQLVRTVRGQGVGVWYTSNGSGNGANIERSGKKAVVLDLQRMNRILDIDASRAYALVEPGVSYRQLYDHLQAKAIPLWMDCDRNPDHSIAGSITSRQIGYTPYGDHTFMQCGMELVLANGEMVRTGMGALPKSDCWQLFKYNFGPYLDGLFAQSDLGIVSKVGLWLMPPPPVYKPFMVTLSDAADLGAMVELMRPLRINQVIPNPVTIASHSFEEALSEGSAQGLGAWNVFGALYGGPDNVDFLWSAVEKAIHSVPSARIYRKDDLPGQKSWLKRQDLMRGVPLQADVRFERSAASRFLELTAAAPMEGGAAATLQRLVSRIAAAANVPYLSEYVLGWRCMFKRIYVPYDGNDPAALAKAIGVSRALMQALTGAGYGIVHESLELRDLVDKQYAGSGLDKLVGRLRAELTKV